LILQGYLLKDTLKNRHAARRRESRALIFPGVAFGKNDFSESSSAALKKRY